MNKGKVTICICSSRSIIDREAVVEVSQTLNKAGYAVDMEADLCEKAISSYAEMKAMAASTVIACYPRAVYSLFARHDLRPAGVLDIRNGSREEILSRFDLTESVPYKSFAAEIESKPQKAGCDAWYPVIDKERCTGCGKCHDFCLFGVYSMEDGAVRVSRPTQCKINCPACARTCPG
ncbi:MAG: 4Fe-4S binding protein, partial [Prevotellaceae bacterium]|nr:4Fe-4S binding protein [Prevotellaceae bacterium]